MKYLIEIEVPDIIKRIDVETALKGSVEKFNSVIGTNIKSIIGKVSKPALTSLFFGDSL